MLPIRIISTAEARLAYPEAISALEQGRFPLDLEEDLEDEDVFLLVDDSRTITLLFANTFDQFVDYWHPTQGWSEFYTDDFESFWKEAERLVDGHV